MNELFHSVYVCVMIINQNKLLVPHFKLWAVQGINIERYSLSKNRSTSVVLNTDFKSVDGKSYHIKYGMREAGNYSPLCIPLDLFLKDEADAK